MSNNGKQTDVLAAAPVEPPPAALAVRFDPQTFWPKDWSEGLRFATMVSKAPSLLPQHIRDSKSPVEEIFAHVLHGFEIGLSPMQALKAIYIVKGKAGLYAADQLAIVQKHPDCEYLRVATDAKGNPLSDARSCTWETKRRSQERPDRLTFTIEEAEGDGLVAQNAKYKTSPRVMLRWRCATRLLAYTWGDVLRGMDDREELEAREKDGGWVERVVAPSVVSKAPAAAEEPPHNPKTGEVIDVDPNSPEAFVATLIADMRAAPSMDALKAMVERGRDVPADLRAALNTAYVEAKKALEGKAK